MKFSPRGKFTPG